MKLLYFIQIVFVYAYTNTGAWFPVISISQISDKKPFSTLFPYTTLFRSPFSIKICYDDYVVWKNGNSWSMVKDVCPHKLAPLSQGRISEDNNIECPYHGQQFNGNGDCVKIPQSNKMPPYTNGVQAIKTHLFNDLLWGFFPCKETQRDDIFPETYYPVLNTLKEPFFISSAKSSIPTTSAPASLA